MLKKIMLIGGVMVILGAGLVLALPRLLPFADLQSLMKEKVRTATGRELEFTGLKLVFFPDIAIALENATLSNAAWGHEKNFFEVGRLDVAFALAPLLERRVEVKRFILNAPVVHLEKNAKGKGNWEFFEQTKSNDKTSFDSADAKQVESKDTQRFQMKLGAVKITKGVFSYADFAQKADYRFDDAEVTVKFDNMQSPLNLTSSFVYRDKPIKVQMDIDQPDAMMKGEFSSAVVDFSAPDMKARFVGNLSQKALKGDIAADVSSLSALQSWIKGQKAAAMPVEKASLKSTVEASSTHVQLSHATWGVEDMTLEGDVSVGLKNKPAITARLTTGKVDLDRWIKPNSASKAEEENQETGTDRATKGSTVGAWDTRLVDLSGLKSADADVVLKTEGLSYKGADIGPTTLTVQLKNGVLNLVTNEVTAFQGHMKAEAHVAASSPPKLEAKLQIKGMQAEPLLNTFAEFKKLSGTLTSDLDIKTSGKSQRDWVSALSGNGQVFLRNGVIKGINLVDIASMLQRRLTAMSMGNGQTEFVEMGGTFKIAQGTLTNQDLALTGPLVHATGAGQVDLPQRYVKYRVVPVLSTAAQAAGATGTVPTTPSGLEVPVDIYGPFSALNIKPDYGSMIRNAVQNPTQIRDQIRNFRKQGKPLLQELKKDPAAALQSLLGGGGAPQSESQPATPPPSTTTSGESTAPEAPAAPPKDPAAAILENLIGGAMVQPEPAPATATPPAEGQVGQ